MRGRRTPGRLATPRTVLLLLGLAVPLPRAPQMQICPDSLHRSVHHPDILKRTCMDAIHIFEVFDDQVDVNIFEVFDV